jgi:hypothetical protein
MSMMSSFFSQALAGIDKDLLAAAAVLNCCLVSGLFKVFMAYLTDF